MGLDMNLHKRDKSGNLVFEYGYWRKANHIHNWFVVNCQDGIDECQEAEVTKDKIEELHRVCTEIMDTHKKLLPDVIKLTLYEDILPTVEGFFFGGTDYDEDYIQDVEDTINILNNVLEGTNFETDKIIYLSSW
jgi:hypothetical protein